jgi:hypothetical protein
MFGITDVFGVFRFLLRWLFARRRVAGVTRRETAAGTVMKDTPEGRLPMNPGFDMRSEIAKLAERIVEPIAAKLTEKELEPVVGRIRHAFEQLDKTRTATDTDLESVAVNIIEPVRPVLSEAEFARIVDRLRGAMAGFCQRSDWGQSAA